ncbi:hypothetical protein JL722_8940 [Aureococcus anophagefferens]|nr:hypothetical protein JL722_8940 [Aureococcus anophagefferens]
MSAVVELSTPPAPPARAATDAQASAAPPPAPLDPEPSVATPVVDEAEVAAWRPLAEVEADSGDENEYDVLESSLCGEYSSTGGVAMNHKTQNGVVKAQKAAIKVANYQGRDDRGTSEQVMDPRTRLILFKLLSRGAAALAEAAGDAAGAAAVADLAVKIYKTSILVFKDRQRYVDGEHRFRNGYSKGKNPRKMVQLWAEKELRNYKRLVACGVRAPRPVLLKGNVLTCRAMRVMYKRCRLVHGDLSEYNLLWHDKEVVVIDVSQSVEHDHPRASEFLRKDCANVNDFFGKTVPHPIEPLSLRELFDFARMEAARCGDAQDDAVFMNAFLPRSLNELGFNTERAQRERDEGANEACYDAALDGLLKAEDPADDDDDASTGDEEEEEEDDDEEEEAAGRLPDGAEGAERKKAAAKAQKEARREPQVQAATEAMAPLLRVCCALGVASALELASPRRRAVFTSGAAAATTRALPALGDEPAYAGTAEERRQAVFDRIKTLGIRGFAEPWPKTRRNMLWAGGLKDEPRTRGAFSDYNHCDLVCMLPSVFDESNADGAVKGISTSNALGEAIRGASLAELGAGGSWATCMLGCGSEPPRDVAHRKKNFAIVEGSKYAQAATVFRWPDVDDPTYSGEQG